MSCQGRLTPEPFRTSRFNHHNHSPPPPTYPEHANSPPYDPSSAQQSGWAGPYPSNEASSSDALPATDGPLKPWLGLKARLALSPISVALISLIFVGARLLVSAGDIDGKVQDAKDKLLATCAGAEGAASIAASLPHFMAESINAHTIESVENSVRAAGRVLTLAITAIEETLTWLVDSYRSLFVCFIELLVRGTLSVLISAVELISSAVHDTAQGIRAAIQTSIQGVNSVLSGSVSAINEVIGVFGQHIDPPTIDMPALDALNNVSLPSVIQDGLLKVNSSLPTLDELREKMDTLIRGPFEEMKIDINNTISNFSFNKSALPVPEMNNVSFCHEINTAPLDELGQDLTKLAYIGAGLIALLMIGLILLSAGIEWWSWRCLRQHVENTREAWLTTANPDGEKDGNDIPRAALTNDNLFSLMQLSSHPLLAMFAFRMSNFCGLRSPRSRANFRWWFSWISHPAAVAALVAGLVGLLSIEIQIMAVKSTSRYYQGKIGDSFDSIGGSLLNNVNSQMLNASHDFADKSNVVILGAQDALNDHLFSWVSTTTKTMNDTLNEFMDGISEALQDTLGSTPLQQPLQTFIDCFLGRKVAGIEKALTWIHDNAQVNFTLVDDNVLLLGNERQKELIEPIKDSVVGNQQDDIGVVPSFVNTYLRQLERERIMFYIFLLIYALVVVAGLVVIFWASSKGGLADWRESKSPWLKAPVTPFRSMTPLRRKRDSGLSEGAAKPKPWRMLNISYPLCRSASQQSRIPRGMDGTVTLGNLAPLDYMSPQPLHQRSTERSSWLSFLHFAGSPKNSIEQNESSSERFERLFGLGIEAQSPTTARPSSRNSTRSAYSMATGATAADPGLSRSESHRTTNSNVGRAMMDDDAASISSSRVASPLRHRFTPSLSGGIFGDHTLEGDDPRLRRQERDLALEKMNDPAPEQVTTDARQSRASNMLRRTKTVLVNAAAWWYGMEDPPISEPARDTSQDVQPIKRNASDQRRQLRFTATPTNEVEARKRAKELADAPSLPIGGQGNPVADFPRPMKRYPSITVQIPVQAPAQEGKPPRPFPDPPAPRVTVVQSHLTLPSHDQAKQSVHYRSVSDSTSGGDTSSIKYGKTSDSLKNKLFPRQTGAPCRIESMTGQNKLLRRVLGNESSLPCPRDSFLSAQTLEESPKLSGKRVIISRPLPHPLGNRIHPCEQVASLPFPLMEEHEVYDSSHTRTLLGQAL